jgi:cell division protein ZipA
MSELRWILIGLGLLLIGGLYLWGRKPFGRLKLLPGRREVSPILPSSEDAIPPEPVPEAPRSYRKDPERIVTLRIVHREQDQISAEDAVLALKRSGLVHGQYGIFHSLSDDGGDAPRFSVASLTEPGSFDLANIENAQIAGLSVFLVLPGDGDPVARFDAMVELARALSDDLDGVLLDERGSSWSIQRERFLREEIIQYRHQQSRA